MQLDKLIAQAKLEVSPVVCTHRWKTEGGRSCPQDRNANCSQTVYVCEICGENDYGDPGGPGHADCASCEEPFQDDEQGGQQ